MSNKLLEGIQPGDRVVVTREFEYVGGACELPDWVSFTGRAVRLDGTLTREVTCSFAHPAHVEVKPGAEIQFKTGDIVEHGTSGNRYLLGVDVDGLEFMVNLENGNVISWSHDNVTSRSYRRVEN